jgi:hypothetical protein
MPQSASRLSVLALGALEVRLAPFFDVGPLGAPEEGRVAGIRLREAQLHPAFQVEQDHEPRLYHAIAAQSTPRERSMPC